MCIYREIMQKKTSTITASAIAAILTVTVLATVMTNHAFATNTRTDGNGAGGAGGSGGNGGTNVAVGGGTSTHPLHHVFQCANGGSADGGNVGNANGDSVRYNSGSGSGSAD